MYSYTSEIPTFVFHDRACSSPSVQKASTWTCIFASLAPLLWCFLILSPLHPRQFICLSSGLLLYFGHNFLMGLIFIYSLFPHTFALCTRLWAPWVQEWCHNPPCVPSTHPAQYLSQSIPVYGIEVQPARLRSHDDSFMGVDGRAWGQAKQICF